MLLLFVKLKEEITGKTGKDGTKNVDIMGPLKYLNKFWKTLWKFWKLWNFWKKFCEINLILMWSEKCFIVSGTATNQVPTLSIIGTKLYVLIITLSTQNNVDLLQQLKSGFKRAINWNKYQWKVSIQKQSQYLDNLIDSYFHGINRLFILSFENNAHRTSNKRYLLPTIEIKDCNVMTDGQNFFDQPVKKEFKNI